MQQELPGSNIPAFTVSEISGKLKRTLEDTFGHVRIRGELSGFKRAASGHLYFGLKDEKSLMDGVMWKGVAGRLTFRPEDGLEVIATGKVTAYGARSKYQIVVDRMEPAGAGALMALLEQRRKMLAAEGLFEPMRKRPIPFLPQTIGVVTSPTGAVIRDILHRLSDRFPRRVLLWPVIVQGDGAAEQVTTAIQGFNRMTGSNRPDLLIVARGGGSIEDLWAFNEESVVRAAAASDIPLISAVGHETDTTLIDHASDQRAPTPTAAAEMAVPVRSELALSVTDLNRRSAGAVQRLLAERRTRLQGLARGLRDPRQVIEGHRQRLDDLGDALGRALKLAVAEQRRRVGEASAGLRPGILTRAIQDRRDRTGRAAHALGRDLGRLVGTKRQGFDGIAARLRPEPLRADIMQARQTVSRLNIDLTQTGRRAVADRRQALSSTGRMLETLSYKATLGRGYAVIRGAEGRPQTRAAGLQAGQNIEIEFADDRVAATIGPDGAPPAPPAPSAAPKPRRRKKSAPTGGSDQGSLF